MRDKILELAAYVVAHAGRERPADALLREVFKAERSLPRAASREASELVFAWFRWRGWLNLVEPVGRQFDQVRDLSLRFRMSPGSFTPDELMRAVPEWVPGEFEVTPDWLRSLQAPPRLWLRARSGQAPALAGRLENCVAAEPAVFSATLEYQGDRDLFRTPEFHAGEFEVQDIASQAVGILCDPKPGETWWDACAGEGGKLLHLSDLMANRGLIWASDRADWRLRRLKVRAGRARCFNYRAAAWDGGARPPTRTRFQGVLLDAPCSGVGTWQRNPHARWTTTPDDVRELAGVQLRLLEHAAPAVKPGGRLVYAVCTHTRAETSGVAAAFERARPEFLPEAVANPFGIAAPQVHPLMGPQQTGGNGMYVAVWRRTA